jgi:hypothetical protein
MNYTPIAYFIISVFGVLTHNLVEMNKLNRAQQGNFSLKDYIKMERFSILISLVMAGLSSFASTEIKELDLIKKYNLFAFGSCIFFFLMGFFGQSILIFMTGKANKLVNKENEEARAKADQV